MYDTTLKKCKQGENLVNFGILYIVWQKRAWYMNVVTVGHRVLSGQDSVGSVESGIRSWRVLEYQLASDSAGRIVGKSVGR